MLIEAIVWLVDVAAYVALGVEAARRAGERLRRGYVVPGSETERHWTRTEDGAWLALYRYPAAQRRWSEPVILAHGLAVNHSNFDLGPDNSLARYLSEKGFDVWTFDVRGVGASREPVDESGRVRGATFDDIARHDAAAVIARVRALSGAERVLWAGHSMGGMVIAAHLAQAPEAPVAGAVVLGSPFRFGAYRAAPAIVESIAARVVPGVPLDSFFGLLVPFVHLGAREHRFFVNGRNMSVETSRRVLATIFDRVPMTLTASFGAFVRAGRVRSADGRFDYESKLADVRTPMLFVAGAADRQAPPSAVMPAYEALGAGDKRFFIAGRENGFQEDYGHGDLVLGERAAGECFPLVEAWLSERATPVKGDA